MAGSPHTVSSRVAMAAAATVDALPRLAILHPAASGTRRLAVFVELADGVEVVDGERRCVLGDAWRAPGFAWEAVAREASSADGAVGDGSEGDGALVWCVVADGLVVGGWAWPDHLKPFQSRSCFG